MAKQNRLNPKPTSRPSLRSLETKGILSRELVGIRNIVRAATASVEPVGFNLHDLHGSCTRDLQNFYPGVCYASGWVGYNGGRAEILATQGRKGYEGHLLDVSRHYPVNDLATNLLSQPCTRNGRYDPDVPVYGDALLITDRRMHWVFRTWKREASPEEVEMFNNDMLVSPRDLIAGHGGMNPWIFFHQEPCEQDIVALMLRWS